MVCLWFVLLPCLHGFSVLSARCCFLDRHQRFMSRLGFFDLTFLFHAFFLFGFFYNKKGDEKEIGGHEDLLFVFTWYQI